MLPGSTNDPKVEALFDSIEYRQAKLFLIAMAADMNNKNLPADERDEARRYFQEANEAGHGHPDHVTFTSRPTPDRVHPGQGGAAMELASVLGARVRAERQTVVGCPAGVPRPLSSPVASTVQRREHLDAPRFGGGGYNNFSVTQPFSSSLATPQNLAAHPTKNSPVTSRSEVLNNQPIDVDEVEKLRSLLLG